jgi:hypothetical protein
VNADHCGGVWGWPKVAWAFGFGEQWCLAWSDGEEDQQRGDCGQQGDDEYEHGDQSVLAARVVAYPRVTGSAGVVDPHLIPAQLGEHLCGELLEFAEIVHQVPFVRLVDEASPADW